MKKCTGKVSVTANTTYVHACNTVDTEVFVVPKFHVYNFHVAKVSCPWATHDIAITVMWCRFQYIEAHLCLISVMHSVVPTCLLVP